MTDQPASLAEALAAFQAELPAVDKNKTAKVKGETRDGKPFNYEYKYADLADVNKAVLPLLGKHGLAFTCQPTERDDGRFGVAYQLMHSSGQQISGWFPLDPSKKMQVIGGDITYIRRYVLSSMTGVAAEEDTDAQGSDDQGPPVSELIERQRAMRRKDPEVDEHGAATIAEQTRMITGPEPGTTRLATTPPDDPWYDVPSPPALSIPDARPLETQIIMHFNRLGIGAQNRDERLQITALLAGRTDVISSTKQLTDQQRVDVKETLAHCRDRAALDQLLDALDPQTPAAQLPPQVTTPTAPRVQTPGPAELEGTAGPGHQN